MFKKTLAPWIKTLTAASETGGDDAAANNAEANASETSSGNSDHSSGEDDSSDDDSDDEEDSSESNSTDEWSQRFGDQTPEEVAKALEKWKSHAKTWEDRAKKDRKTIEKFNEQLGELEGRPTVEAVERLTVERDDALRETAMMKSLIDGGYDAVALLDSRRFMERVSALDVEADDFPSQLDEVVKSLTHLNGSPKGGVAFRERSPGEQSKQSLWDLVHGDTKK